jgi:hypothetical protein
MGVVSGGIGWRIDDEDLVDAADAISSDAEQLGAAQPRSSMPIPTHSSTTSC